VCILVSFQFLVREISFYDVAENVGCSVLSGCAIRKYCCEVVFARVANYSVYCLNRFHCLQSRRDFHYVYVVEFIVVTFVASCCGAF
jgi:hypothetical protein